MTTNTSATGRALDGLRSALLGARVPAGHWVGELSSSALSTATAVIALATVDRACRADGAGAGPPFQTSLVRGGLDWLARHAGADGGWGDTISSASNLSTTALGWAAFGAAGADEGYRRAVDAAAGWLAARAGGLEPQRLAEALVRRYGNDRTFSVPILTACALGGRLGEGADAWRLVRPLPFELAVLPRAWFKWLRLPVVSYALPALIAVGQARYRHAPPRCPVARLARGASVRRTLRVLESIQPPDGGFLEATPLTSFVTMSLAGSGAADHPVVLRGVDFLARSVRPDGSWPIDANLATWVTTLAVNALAAAPDGADALPAPDRDRIAAWLLGQQHRETHPYTGAAPGGWAWTDLPGGVPDADDTAGAILALRHLKSGDPGVLEAAADGLAWLFDLQNRDGGVPTFCRGWGTLPFDRSGADLTAHALRAAAAWRADLPGPLASRADRFARRAVDFLARARRPDGAWAPLWFGNERATDEVNWTYGTSRVLLALRDAERLVPGGGAAAMAAGAAAWLLRAQHPGGGWGGAPGVPPSFEETALAVEALADAIGGGGVAREAGESKPIRAAMERGAAWLAERWEAGGPIEPAPIGFYFARLWYFERLYPLVFGAAALGRARLYSSPKWPTQQRCNPVEELPPPFPIP